MQQPATTINICFWILEDRGGAQKAINQKTLFDDKGRQLKWRANKDSR